MEKPIGYTACVNGIVRNIPLFAFVKANIYTFPRYLSQTFDHLFYILEERMLIEQKCNENKQTRQIRKRAERSNSIDREIMTRHQKKLYASNLSCINLQAVPRSKPRKTIKCSFSL